MDIVIISGDAYVDHPSFGATVIGRWLESFGYKVGIIAQPDIDTDSDFLTLGVPRLFFGVTSGNMDSMVNHYTANKKLRSADAYTSGGSTGKRPDRAAIRYTQKLKQLCKGVPVILGGIEASLRRIPHYDYWSDKLKNSILADSKATAVVYGMGERAIVEIARQLDMGGTIRTNIPGTIVFDTRPRGTELAGKEVWQTKDGFWDFYKQFYQHFESEVLSWPSAGRYIVHNPPAAALSEAEIDSVYSLPYMHAPHPSYKEIIPAFEQIKLSITSHRGCFGECSFCAITTHQGKKIQSRSCQSIGDELEKLEEQTYFKGSISDIGGPSANMYGYECRSNWQCERKSCLMPAKCPQLHQVKSDKNLYEQVSNRPHVKNVRIASGIRHDLSENFYAEMITKYTGGQLKLAPEHYSTAVLTEMNKPDFAKFINFEEKFKSCSQAQGKEQYIIPYIMLGHPGETLTQTIELALYLKKRNWKLRQIQQFMPTPMSKSTTMYYCGRSWRTGQELHVAKQREVKQMKALVQWFIPENKHLIKEALISAKRPDLIREFKV